MKLKGKRMVILAALFVLFAGSAALLCRAGEHVREVPFKEAEFFIEFNASAADAGVQVFLDGDNWRSLSITDPNDLTELRPPPAVPEQVDVEYNPFFDS